MPNLYYLRKFLNVSYDQNEKKQESVFSKRIKAGKRRTYFFDVKSTRGNDYYLTITESRKRLDDEGYDRHKVFIYKEDLNKFAKALNETIDYIKTDLMPDFDFDAFNHEYAENAEVGASSNYQNNVENSQINSQVSANSTTDSVDKW